MKPFRLLLVISICLAAAGCKTLPNQTYGSPSVEQYLGYLDKLNEMDSKELHQAYKKANSRYSSMPGPETRLHLALVLAQPDHEESNLYAAKSHLLAILNTRTQLPPSLVQFTRIELEYVTALLKQQELAQERELKLENMKRELGDTEKEIEKLKAEKEELHEKLKEANAKLRALTDIEEDLSQVTDKLH